MDPAFSQSGSQETDLGISPGIFPLSALNVGIEIPGEGGTTRIGVTSAAPF